MGEVEVERGRAARAPTATETRSLHERRANIGNLSATLLTRVAGREAEPLRFERWLQPGSRVFGLAPRFPSRGTTEWG